MVSSYQGSSSLRVILIKLNDIGREVRCSLWPGCLIGINPAFLFAPSQWLAHQQQRSSPVKGTLYPGGAGGHGC